MARKISSKNVENISDLTLAAPIKQGFVDAIDNVTYETRLRFAMEAMFKIRATAREYAKVKPFVESAERIQSLLDFRLAIIDGSPKKLLLSVAFDRPFEPYMRLVWDPLGPLLDLFFCNCDGYVIAAENSFADYLKWVRSVQIDSGFFYAATNRTIVDGEYLARIERLYRDGEATDPAIAAASDCVPLPSVQAEDVQAELKKNGHEDVISDLGVQALVAIGRLFDLYPPDDPKEFKYLNRAASRLLKDWNREAVPLHADLAAKLGEYLTVLKIDPDDGYKPAADDLDLDPEIVQGGILRAYDDSPARAETGEEGGVAESPAPPEQARKTATLTHACLLLMRVRDPAAARKILQDKLLPKIDTETSSDPDRDHMNLNLAFTYGGLERLGVPETALGELPQEFRQGMEARAGLLGDIGDAHPRRWALPPRCRAAGPGHAPVAIEGAPPVELSEVDLVLKLRIKDDWNGHELVGKDEHPLAGHVARLLGEVEPALELLAVETMRNASVDADGTDHFNFKDGLSQPHLRHPKVPPPVGAISRDKVALGEILIGFANDHGDPPPPRSAYWDHGTYLVVRKLRQSVEQLEELIGDAVRDLPKKHPVLQTLCPDLLRDEIRSQLMGRHPKGQSLIKGAGPSENDFDYRGDVRGQQVPFQSHVRRTNPRVTEHGRPTPRILRRGLSYGPPRGQGTGERGIVFMAYNASIAEQFEVVQSWISGGNSTRVASAQSDPLMGPARHRDRRTFLFRIRGQAVRLSMPIPFVTLQWGAYLFVPSIRGIEAIAADPPAVQDSEALEGVAIMERIGLLPRQAQALAWKTVFEDMIVRDPDLGGVAPKVWAAIRARGGAVRVPYGDPATGPGGGVREAVVVATPELVDRVLKEDATFSVEGYRDRLDGSIGMIYLGLDRGRDYQEESKKINAEISAVSAEHAFAVARGSANKVLQKLRMDYARMLPEAEGGVKIDLVHEYIAGTLALVCRRYFGLPDQPIPPEPASEDFEVGRGPWRWTPHAARKPVCPGDFIAPSSFIFYLDPVKGMVRRGAQDGKALRAAAERYFAKKIAADAPPPEKIARAVWDTFVGQEQAAERMGSTLIGVMMGFLPPADGNLRGILYDWLSSRELWRIQHDLLKVADRANYAAVAQVLAAPLRKAMQKRPAPDALWRTAKRSATLGPVEVRPGDKIYVGIVSATAELAKRVEAVAAAEQREPTADERDVWPVFGGDRGAPDSPTHACPAFGFAMGIMTGTLSALLEVGRIEALPAPLIVTVPRLPS